MHNLDLNYITQWLCGRSALAYERTFFSFIVQKIFFLLVLSQSDSVTLLQSTRCPQAFLPMTCLSGGKDRYEVADYIQGQLERLLLYTLTFIEAGCENELKLFQSNLCQMQTTMLDRFIGSCVSTAVYVASLLGWQCNTDIYLLCLLSVICALI